MILALDSENTTWNKGNPFDQRNFNVCWSWHAEDGSKGVDYDLNSFAEVFARATLIVGFNLKYDLHWLRKMGFDFSDKKLWCCQVAEFLKSRQTIPYPSLNGVGASYGLGQKIDVIASEYWARGVNTHEIPRAILTEYAQQDASLTLDIYHAQVKSFPPGMMKLAKLQMEDLRVLEDIEWNGLYYDPDVSNQLQQELESQIESIKKDLSLYHSVPGFNWASGDHLSALLYGGQIETKRRIPNGLYKSGAKAGQVKFSIETQTYNLKRKYTPLRGTELAKEGKWKTDIDTLTKLKGDRKLLDGILEISKLETLNGTFVRGLSKKHEEMQWPARYIHGQYNQVVTATGRLSSSSPNMQNIASSVLNQFITRF